MMITKREYVESVAKITACFNHTHTHSLTLITQHSMTFNAAGCCCYGQ